MRTTNINIVTNALADNDHAYVAIRPADAVPAISAPGFLLESHTLTSFLYQLDSAADYWPDCTKWQLIAADYANPQQEPEDRETGPDTDAPPPPGGGELPPGLRTLAQPVVIANFNTEAD